MPRSVRGLTGLALLVPALAAAHDPSAPAGWRVDPWIGALMLASVLVQVAGLRAMRNRRAIAPNARILAYVVAMATLVLALFSPLEAWAARSFAWHMLQHLLLMLVAAPLLALSNAHFVALFALPPRWRAAVGRAVGWLPGAGAGARHPAGPWIAALAFAMGLWLWHAPALYEAALHARALHSAEHLVFLLTAAVFWRMVVTAGNRRLSPGAAIVLVTLVGLQGNLMAALITLAPQPLYPSYALAGLEDQQRAGLLMWIPAALVYLASTVFVLARLMREPVRPARSEPEPPAHA
jgi:cytochrome c oxidase assembly factor CtaG